MQCLSEKLNCNALRAFQAFIINAHYKNMSTITQTNVNGVTFVTHKHMSPEGPIFLLACDSSLTQSTLLSVFVFC